jgi:hypothetical protein
LTMALRKSAVVLLIEAFVILPILLEARGYHGYDSYKQYYDNRVNGEQLKHPMTASDKITEKSHYHNDVKKEIKSRFEDNSKNANSESDFVFPDEWQTRNGGNNYIKVTHCDDKKQTFCEYVPYYPEKFVNQALAKNSSLLHYAHEDVIAVVPRSDTEEEPLCLSVERIIRPKTGLNLKDEWLFILQSNESNFHQSVRIETCQEEDAKCRMIDGFAEGYVTTCKQKYIYRELSAISNDGEIVRDYFRFPASCCCHVQFKADDEAIGVGI